VSSPWQLPTEAVIHGQRYPIHGDFRDILEIFGYLEDRELPEYLRWQIALALFYDDIPQDRQAALDFLAEFLSGGSRESEKPGPKLLDWQQDAPMIVADVNKVAGQEIRALPFVHWWTFLSWFHAIGEGQLSTVVSIRHKLQSGKKLEKWEQDFYRENKKRVDIPKRYTSEEKAQKTYLQNLLKGKP